MLGRLTRWLLPLVLAGALGVGAAIAATSMTHSKSGTVKTATNAKYGTVLVSASGRTLYRYTADKKGVIVCKGACIAYWPPLTVKTGTKPTAGTGAQAQLLGTIKRGKALQVTYAGYPLYRYVGDQKSGDVKGQGFQGTWYVVNSKGALVKRAAPPTTTTSKTTTSTTTKAGWG
jgi:predicted lipoprotein with Yx(FWY)xxD motif